MADNEQSILDRLSNAISDEPLPATEGESVTGDSDPETELEPAATADESVEVEQDEQESEEPESEPTEPVKYTLDDIAEATGKTKDELLAELELEIDGKPVPLSELKKGTLREADYTRKTMALAEQRKAFEEQAKTRLATLDQNLIQVGEVMRAAEQQLMTEFESINWNELEQYDPGMFAAQRQKYGERYNHIQRMKANAIQAYEQQKAMASERLAKEIVPKEREALLTAIPGWRDPAKARDEQAKVGEILQKTGYTPDELESLHDHRLVVLAYKAMQYDAIQSKAPGIKEKVKTLPKVLKAKGAKPKVTAEQAKANDLRQRLRKFGNPEDARELIKQKLLREG